MLEKKKNSKHGFEKIKKIVFIQFHSFCFSLFNPRSSQTRFRLPTQFT